MSSQLLTGVRVLDLTNVLAGPFAAAPAYDQIIQRRSGVMSVTGDAHSAPLRVGYPVCDTISGITAAFAISSALVRPHPAYPFRRAVAR